MIRGLKHESKAALAMQHATLYDTLLCILANPSHTDAAGLNRPEP